MVIAMVNGNEATVKRYYREQGGWIRLQPANPAMQPMRFQERDVLIQGVVVGVNVSTAGEQVSFLVPVDRVIALVGEATRPGYVRPDSLLRTVAQQLLSYQDTYLARLFADSTRTVTLGGYQVPTEPAPFFKCWGDASHSRTRPYETIEHQCSTDDYVFISGEQWSGVLTLQHTVLSTRDLNRFRFYSLLTSQFSGDGFEFQGREVVTPQRCTTGNVRQPGLALTTVFCTRRYRKLDGLYDVFFKAATLGDPSSGLITTLTLSGVTFENARRAVERFLASLGRAPECSSRSLTAAAPSGIGCGSSPSRRRLAGATATMSSSMIATWIRSTRGWSGMGTAAWYWWTREA